jgi:D-arabinose 1-dehydrogenase-like Zn-dependent alcohol dehydrogenase
VDQVGTYNGVYKKGNGKGMKSYGGYANYHRCFWSMRGIPFATQADYRNLLPDSAPGHFVLPIPKGLDPALAAPMMCEFAGRKVVVGRCD